MVGSIDDTMPEPTSQQLAIMGTIDQNDHVLGRYNVPGRDFKVTREGELREVAPNTPYKK